MIIPNHPHYDDRGNFVSSETLKRLHETKFQKKPDYVNRVLDGVDEKLPPFPNTSERQLSKLEMLVKGTIVVAAFAAIVYIVTRKD